MNFLSPGPHPMYGDTIHITLLTSDMTRTGAMTLTGKIMSREILRDGRGLAEITLDANPDQRRTIARSARYRYTLYREGQRLYSSPSLRVREIQQTAEAVLILGSP